MIRTVGNEAEIKSCRKEINCLRLTFKAKKKCKQISVLESNVSLEKENNRRKRKQDTCIPS